MNETTLREREHTKGKVQAALKTIRDTGSRPEEIASAMEVSFNTIMNWVSGRRVPKAPAIRQLEHLYGVKIL